MKRWIHAATDSNKVVVEKAVRDYVESRIADGLKDNTAFLNGDKFAWCQDEVAHTGHIEECVNELVSAVEENPSLLEDEDDLIDILYDNDCIRTLFSLSEIVSLFRKNGVDLPDWYFE